MGECRAKAGGSVGGKAGGVQAVESRRRLDERGNKELYRLLNREVTGQKALSGSTTVLSCA